jgi:hypothetical protein
MSAILLLIALLAGANVEASETCEKKLDLAFIVDGSTTVCGLAKCPKWTAALEFCKSIVNALTIGPELTRVAFLTYGDEIEVEWDLSRYPDKTQLLEAIDRVQYNGGELTDYDSVAEIIIGVFNPIDGDRVLTDNIQNILVVVADGSPGHLDQEWAVAAHAIQADGVGIFFNCIKPCTEHLSKCVSSPPKQANETYFMLDGYDKLEQIRDHVVKKFCSWTLPQGLLEYKPELFCPPVIG